MAYHPHVPGLPKRWLRYAVMGVLCFVAVGAAHASATAAAATTEPSALAKQGMSLLSKKSCTACHTTDGRKQVGPTFLGYFGSKIATTSGGVERTITVDAAHIRRAVKTPNADLQAGYPANTMPAISVTEDELAAIVAALEHLAAPAVVTTRKRADGSISSLLLAVIAFILGHLILSSTPLRSPIIAKVGFAAFQGLYSLVIGGVFVWVVWAYIKAPYVPLWTPPLWTRWIPLLVMGPVLAFQVGSFTLKNPAGKKTPGAEAAVGMARITRHPGQWSNAFWGLCHLPPNGDLATVLIMGGLLTLAVVGMLHIETRKRREANPQWLAYCEKTSVVPFAAIFRGRNRLAVEELAVPIVAGLAVFVGFLFLHATVIGQSPWPY